jgi:hypothetical protein
MNLLAEFTLPRILTDVSSTLFEWIAYRFLGKQHDLKETKELFRKIGRLFTKQGPRRTER